jgi:hypothetical protein
MSSVADGFKDDLEEIRKVRCPAPVSHKLNLTRLLAGTQPAAITSDTAYRFTCIRRSRILILLEERADERSRSCYRQFLREARSPVILWSIRIASPLLLSSSLERSIRGLSNQILLNTPHRWNIFPQPRHRILDRFRLLPAWQDYLR